MRSNHKDTILWIVGVLFILLVVLMFQGDERGPYDVRTITDVNTGMPISVDFGTSRIKVVGWDKDQVKVEVNGLPKNPPLGLKVENNRIVCKSPLKVQPYWEPAFRIFLPEDTPLNISAGEIWAQDCTLTSTTARFADLKKCTLTDGYIGEGGHLNVRRCDVGRRSLFKKEASDKVMPVTIAARRNYSCYR